MLYPVKVTVSVPMISLVFTNITNPTPGAYQRVVLFVTLVGTVIPSTVISSVKTEDTSIRSASKLPAGTLIDSFPIAEKSATYVPTEEPVLPLSMLTVPLKFMV